MAMHTHHWLRTKHSLKVMVYRNIEKKGTNSMLTIYIRCGWWVGEGQRGSIYGCGGGGAKSPYVGVVREGAKYLWLLFCFVFYT